nr:uncharacterized protein LOC127328965 [Lolium perenne]
MKTGRSSPWLAAAPRAAAGRAPPRREHAPRRRPCHASTPPVAGLASTRAPRRGPPSVPRLGPPVAGLATTRAPRRRPVGGLGTTRAPRRRLVAGLGPPASASPSTAAPRLALARHGRASRRPPRPCPRAALARHGRALAFHGRAPCRPPQATPPPQATQPAPRLDDASCRATTCHNAARTGREHQSHLAHH